MKLYQPISSARQVFLATLSFAVFVATWWAVSATMESAKIFLPSPWEVLTDGIALFRERSFVRDVGASVWRVTVGFIAAAVFSLPIGILAGTNRSIEALTQPFNDFLRYMPVAAFIPLTILWVGIDDLQKIVIIFLGTALQLIPMIADTAARVPRHLIDLGYTMGARPRHILLRVVIPWCMPAIYDHLRVALGWAWSYLVVAEVVAASSGIGHVIIQSQRFIQTGNVIAGVLVIGVIGLLFDQLFKLLRKPLFRWL